VTKFHNSDPTSESTPPGLDKGSIGAKPKPSTTHERNQEQKGQEQHEWTVDEEGIVDEPSDRSAPDFNDDLDPSDAP